MCVHEGTSAQVCLHAAPRGSWGTPCHSLARKLCQVDENWMECLTAITWMNTQAEQKGSILSGAESWLQSTHGPRGNSLLLFSAQPSVSVDHTSQPLRGVPSLPTWLSDVQTSASVFPSLSAGGKVTQHGLPKTGGNCAQKEASHNPQSYCICETILNTKNRMAWFLLSDLSRNSPSSPADRKDGIPLELSTLNHTHLLSNGLGYRSPQLAFSPFLL